MFRAPCRCRWMFPILLGMLLLSMSLDAAPLKNVPVVVEQPDGTMMQLYASGDEFYNVLHDALGYTVVKDPKTGTYVYAEKSDDSLEPSAYIVGTSDPVALGLSVHLLDSAPTIRQRRITSPILQGRTELPPTLQINTTGTLNNLVVFIRFSDQDQFVETLEHFETFFNAGNDVSMADYYDEVSDGQLQLVSSFYPSTSGPGVISFQDSHTRNYYLPYDASSNPEGYEGGEYGSERIQREHTLLKKAVEAISAQVPSSLDVDSDDDGYVDSVVFVIQGGPEGWSTLLWPHQWVLYSESATVNGARVFVYNFQLQETLDVGVLCHEMFHSLGAPDLYNYDGYANPVGPWDLMDSTTEIPQHMGAFMKMRYGGWFDSIPEITASGTYTLASLNVSPFEAYKIVSEDSADEYFVVEHRRATGRYESSLPGSGLLVYRIDTTRDGLGNADGPPNEVYLFRPGGNLSDDGNVYEAHLSSDEGRTIFGTGQNPYPFFSDGSMATDFSIREIGSSGAQIQFEVSFCSPDCDGKNCGDDGCGGSCGECLPNSECVDGVCSECIPLDCETRECGDDGCGGSCGECDGGADCSDEGTCVTYCPMEDLGSVIGDAVSTGTTSGMDNHFEPSCVSNSYAGEVSLSWTVPEYGLFEFNTDGSSYDTTLTILANGCNGTELGCDDDSGEGSRSKLQLELPAGQTIVILIDGYGTHEGSYRLNITQLCMSDCENKECGDDGCGGSCGDCLPNAECVDGTCDVCVPFDCTERECGEDGCGGSCGDCPEGEKCSDEGACFTFCPVEDLGNQTGDAVGSGSTQGRDDDFSPSCLNSSDAGDMTYLWQAPETGTFVFDTDGSSFDTALTLLSGGCLGDELACDDDGGESTRSRIEVELNEGDALVIVIDGYSTHEGTFVLNITPPCHPDCEGKNCGDDGCGDSCGECEDGYLCDENGQCSICVPDCDGKNCGDDGCEGSCGECEGFDVCGDDGQCVSNCPLADLGQVIGDAVATGSTSGGYNQFSPSCVNNSNANDVAYLWTAPLTAVYTFTTDGSGFDTVLTVLEGACDGEVLACDDDDGEGARSLVKLTLDEGQAVIFVIDAYGSNSGNYQLNILEPCIPDCDGKNCGDNGCGGSCGECDVFDHCDESGQCVARQVASVPFSDSFDEETLSAVWTASSTDSGRVQVSGEYEPNSEPYHVLMDSETDYALNVLELLVDLSQSSDMALSFMVKRFNDEAHTMPENFQDSFSDGVALSTDGVNWRRLFDLATDELVEQTYTRLEIHLGDWAADRNIQLTDKTLIRFQQYDNSSLDADGFAFDDVEIDTCFPDCTGKICGDDGCGGSCGECGDFEICSADGSSCDPTCPTDDLGSALGSPVVAGSTTGMEDFFQPSCQWFYEAPEVTYLWEAPESGYYEFTLDNTTFTPLLFLLESDCEGEEVACTTNTSIERYIEAGERLVIGVDGQYAQSGDFDLNIELTCVPDCEGRNCGDDGCGGTCGECSAFESCSENGTCEARDVAPFPFFEDFEAGELASYWETYSTGSGRIWLSTEYEPQGGSQHILMDSTSANALNELVLIVDLSGQDNIMLSFWHKNFSDESHVMPEQFEEHDNSDGVALSIDGLTWYKIQGLDSDEGISTSYKEFQVDLDETFASLGLDPSTRTLLKFQQYDNASINADGFAFDTISIETCIHDCTGKICGDDGCGDSCGECDDMEICSPDGSSCDPACPSDDLGSALGSPVVSGSTIGMDDFYEPSCKWFGEAPEVTYLWEAPESGFYEFTLDNATFTPMLFLLESDCEGEEVACIESDDNLERYVEAGESLVIGVEGQYSQVGDFELNIELTCAPDCEGRNCGDDGCGGTCGECSAFESCSENGVCEAIDVASFPFFEDFEDGELASYWGTYSTGEGRVWLSTDYYPQGGSQHLLMDSMISGSNALNELVLIVDLSGQDSMMLSFWHKHFRDQKHVMPEQFEGHSNSDGVALSVDGLTWYKISELGDDYNLAVPSEYAHYRMNLVETFATLGLDPSDHTLLKFQQYDNSFVNVKGFAFDTISIETCIPDCTGKICGDDGCEGTCGECEDYYECTEDGTACEQYCPLSDIQGQTGQAIATGDTSSSHDHFTPSCVPLSTAPDVSLLWSAPENGIYRFDTEGSAYDTVLYLLDGSCGGVEIACDNNGGAGQTSLIESTMVAGYPVIIVIDGYYPESGEFQLNIERTCIPECDGKDCGDDGCGGVCGECDPGLTCNAQGQCITCIPDCDGKECGSDGCGGSCGSCDSDGVFCNGDEFCVMSQGLCVHSGNPCTGGDVCNNTCNEEEQTCFSDTNTVCNDGVFCNGTDTCNGQGECTVHEGDPCVGGDACNDTCNEGARTCFSSANTTCDDGMFCNGADVCDGQGGCTIHTGDPCVGGEMCNDNCNEQRDNCVSPNGSDCDDGQFCTLHDACIQGQCHGAGNPCNDNLTCTTDICDENDDSCRYDPDDTRCLDGLFCNGEERCDIAVGCVHGTSVELNDGIDCTEDACNEGDDTADNLGWVEHLPNDGLCDDDSFCTADRCDEAVGCRWSPDNEGDVCMTASDIGGSCENGVCVPDCSANADCDDGIACTEDACDTSIGKCTYRAMDDRCDDGNPCTDDSCNSSQGCIFVNDDTNSCDDELFCTAQDRCRAGTCVGEGSPCNDYVACTVDSCVEADDTCRYVPDDGACDDGNVCTADSCDTDAGCLYDPDHEDEACTNAQGDGGTCSQGLCLVECTVDEDCDDGVDCTRERCDTVAGKCVVRPDDGLCDDDNSCTDDVCLANQGCRFTPNDANACDDGLFCTVNDRCLGSSCVGDPNACGDGIECTADRCNEQANACEHHPDDAVCDDGSICTADSCDTDAGCLYDPDHEQASCLTPAGQVGACESGVCTPECTGNAECDDGIACTRDRCDTTTGTCIFEAVNERCNDGNPCTADSCSTSTGCRFVPDDTGSCDDGLFCTVNDRCENGSCIGGDSPCDDGVACTRDVCNEQSDECEYQARDWLCGDENVCTVDVCNTQLGCLNPATNEGGACTTPANQEGTCLSGVCSPECTNDGDCDDFVSCTEDSCDAVAGRCRFIPNADLCDDGNPCTQEFCNTASGCRSIPDDNYTCNDGLFCTENDRCSNGRCIADARNCDDSVACTLDFCDDGADLCVHRTQNNLCNDGNPCTDDVCDEALGCREVNDDTNPCTDDMYCTVNDRCESGTCIGDERNCEAFEDDCNLGVCDEYAGSCVALPKADDTSCDDGLFCTEGDICYAGQCNSGAERDCSIYDTDCTVGACDDVLDQCFADPVDDLTPCNDGMFCTGSDRCHDGVCTGEDLDCSDWDGACTVGVCDEDGMTCYAQSLPDATDCDDENVCTQNDACLSGNCMGTPIECDDDDPCTENLCHPESGCDFATMDDWSVCNDDGDPASACFGGECEVIAQNDRCEDAVELLEDQPVVLSMADAHPSRTVEPPCTSQTISRADVFYRISTEGGRYYDVTVETTSTVDLAVVAWTGCDEDALCLVGSVERDSFAGIEMLAELVGDGSEIMIQVLVEASDGSDDVGDITITVNGYYLYDGGDEDLTEDDNVDVDIADSDIEGEEDLMEDADRDFDFPDSNEEESYDGDLSPADEDGVAPGDLDFEKEDVTGFKIGSGGCRSLQVRPSEGIAFLLAALLVFGIVRRSRS